MSEMFETDSTSAMRRSTGSKFIVNLTPPEFAECTAWYENPRHGLKVGFDGIWTYERKAVERNGKTIARRFSTGVLVVEGQLSNVLKKI
jgi:hypothetical protein